MGEPGGIGPEVALRAYEHSRAHCDAAIVGDPQVIGECAQVLGLEIVIDLVDEPVRAMDGHVAVIETPSAQGYAKGKPTPAGGRACAQAIEKAVSLCQAGQSHGIVTAPISKEALKLAGLRWPGHTEMLAELTGTSDYAMMLVGGGLRVVLATIHTSIKNVPGLLNEELILKTIKLAHRACRMLSINTPRIAVAALNPHAGESGMFGEEEVSIITPAIKRAQEVGIAATGPYPPDTVFYRACRGQFDIVVCMYHDQGLIPLKLLGFESGVNVTIGLPFVRTSPDHGTAYDIAWKGQASGTSTIEALELALVLAEGKQ